LEEHGSSTKSRTYRKVRRAEDERATRARIVDAAEALHAEVGPARATISAIAERAGVTRATVYRHFPDDESLFLACSGQWQSRQLFPDRNAWDAHDDPYAVLHSGLMDIYRFFRAGEPMLTAVLRDADVVPPRVKQARLAREAAWREQLIKALPGRRLKTVRAAVGHAISFGTWRSLCLDQRLSNDSAADLMVATVGAAAGTWSRDARRTG
jgi:AcrR family transcriptional regulator